MIKSPILIIIMIIDFTVKMEPLCTVGLNQPNRNKTICVSSLQKAVAAGHDGVVVELRPEVHVAHSCKEGKLPEI